MIRKRPGPQLANAVQAHRSPTTHQLRGRRYIDHGTEPAAPRTAQGPTDACKAPLGVQDGSYHFLTTPGKAQKLVFRWLARHGAWARPKGVRMAFKAEYLSRLGWAYHSPAAGPHDGATFKGHTGAPDQREEAIIEGDLADAGG